MAWLSANERAILNARLVAKNAQLTAMYAAIEAGSTEVESFTLDTGEASQRMKYRNVTDMIAVARLIENDIDRINRRPKGVGLVNLNLRRR